MMLFQTQFRFRIGQIVKKKLNAAFKLRQFRSGRISLILEKEHYQFIFLLVYCVCLSIKNYLPHPNSGQFVNDN